MEVEPAIHRMEPVARTAGPDVHAHALSRREQEVLAVIALGRTNQQAAAELDVSVHAVKFHLASIYRKLGVTNRTEAVVRLLREGTA